MMQYCERCMLDAATRLLQISIEAVLDISQHIVSRKHLGIPKTYRESVELLVKSGILSKKKLPNLINMIKFRNRVQYNNSYQICWLQSA